MRFVRRPPGEERPAPQWHDGLCHFLSPSRRYVALVQLSAWEFKYCPCPIQLADSIALRMLESGSAREQSTVLRHVIHFARSSS